MIPFVGLAIGGIILVCLGRSSMTTQSSDVSSPSGNVKVPVEVAIETPNMISKPVSKTIMTGATTRSDAPSSVASGSIYKAYQNNFMAQTQRFQRLS